jgi:uncharacterized protein HemX
VGFEEPRGEIGNRIVDIKRLAELEKSLDRFRERATITWQNAEPEKAYKLALTRLRNATAIATQQGLMTSAVSVGRPFSGAPRGTR